eukprot:564667-Pyramimonas_sp.AAC.1
MRVLGPYLSADGSASAETAARASGARRMASLWGSLARKDSVSGQEMSLSSARPEQMFVSTGGNCIGAQALYPPR